MGKYDKHLREDLAEHINAVLQTAKEYDTMIQRKRKRAAWMALSGERNGCKWTAYGIG